MSSNLLPLYRPEPLQSKHQRDNFDCGVTALNRFLKEYSWQNQKNSSARTYVSIRGENVVGYYTLVYGGAAYIEAPLTISKGLARHPIPVMILARLAVDQREQGRSLGKALLRDAILRTSQAADIAGLRAMLVHAKDDRARNFYGHFGFQPSPINDLHLFLGIDDIQQNVAMAAVRIQSQH